MRWWTPVMSMARKATTDVPLRDKVIRKGDGVLLLYSSANRDEERWGDDVGGRFASTGPTPPGSSGFGIGEHFCMGAHLAPSRGPHPPGGARRPRSAARAGR